MENNKANNDNSARKADEPAQDSSPRWRLAEHAFAIIGAAAALIAVVGVIIVGIEHTPAFQMHREEGMVSNLIAGDDYAKMVALIGAEPDFHKSLPSGRQLYVFDRQWEYIQLLVDSSDTVLSVGVYAKTTEFKATLVTGAVVNGPPVGQQLLGDPLGAYGSCGASWFYYFQGYSLPAAGNFRSEIVGNLPVTDTDKSLSDSALCKLFFTNASCLIAYYRSAPAASPLSNSLLSCIDSLKDGRATLANLLTSIVIVTAPGQSILPDMFNEDYFVNLAHV